MKVSSVCSESNQVSWRTYSATRILVHAILTGLCVLLSVQYGVAQYDLTSNSRNRELYEAFLKIQDRRSFTDKTALSAFGDSSNSVRRSAVLVYASLQDTTVLNTLLERFSTEPDASVGIATAFTIGQLGVVLSRRSVESLEHELLWERIDRVSPQVGDRMVEEIGRFGTQKALDDIVNKYLTQLPVPHRDAIIMSFARFAIRGIFNDDATKWLLELSRNPDGTTWQVMYALQRIGRSPVTITALRDVLPIGRDNKDPMVRMYFATLLGKLKDERTLDVLKQLAESDGDWHVRVNAIRALGNYSITDKADVLDLLRRAFLSDNLYIAVTAMNVAGTSGLKQGLSPDGDKMLDAIRGVALNDGNGFLWQLQAEAAMAWAKLKGPAAVTDLKHASGDNRLLRVAILTALGTTGSDLVLKDLAAAVRSDDKLIARGALDSMPAIGSRFPKSESVISTIRNACFDALETGDVALVATAAQILSDPPYINPDAGEKLADALSHCRLPDDVEAMQSLCGALASYNSPRIIEVLEKQLKQSDQTVMAAAAASLQKITRNRYPIESRLEPVYTDFDFDYLFALPSTVRVRIETIRGDIEVELYRDVAPFTVMSFLKLATQRGFFQGKTFHRVVPNFVIQGGDPRGDGWGGPEYAIRSEFSPMTFTTGTLGMASGGKDTEGSQFFICQSPQPHLDGKYTIFGQVTKGIDVVDKIQIDDHIFDVKILK